jgi:hypothetical protein
MPKPANWRSGACRAVCLLAVTCAACTPKPLGDPRTTARGWADAVRAEDVEAVFALLTPASQQILGRQGVARLLRENQKELLAHAESAAAANARLDATVEVAYADDRRARVVLEDGRFHVAAAGALPAAASNPTDALRELREVLARRSFDGLLRVLTRDTAQSLESSLQGLADALEEPSTLDIQVEGRRALARLPGGHTVTLEREDGVWRIKDFD